MRLLLNRLLGAVSVVVAAPLAVLAEFVRAGSGGRVVRAVLRVAAPLMGVRVEVRGQERLDVGCPYVFTPNHGSLLDIPALLLAHPGVRFAAAVELFANPVLAPTMRALGTIPIARGKPEVARRALADAAARLGRASCLVIFPEGRLAPRGQLLPFKSGGFVFAIEAGVSVVPVAVHNAAALLPAGARLAVRPGTVVVEMLAPIPATGLTIDDRHRLRDAARESLAAALRPVDGGTARRRDLDAVLSSATRRGGRSRVARRRTRPGGSQMSDQVGDNATEGFTTPEERQEIRRVTGPTDPPDSETGGTTGDEHEGVPTGERGAPEPPPSH